MLRFLLFALLVGTAEAQYVPRQTSGGTTNTGNATVADVASPKTFSSATLTNATGTSTKNATVAGDVSIQPPQAWVACLGVNLSFVGNADFQWQNKGITSIDPTFLWNLLQQCKAAAIATGGGSNIYFNASGNAITNVDAILAALASNNIQNAFIGLSGGTTADPTDGLDNSDLQQLANSSNCIGYVNVGGVPTAFGGG